jgi:hypothetical protein
MTQPENSPTTESPGSTAETAAQQGSAVASTAKEQASATAQTAQQGSQQVADQAKQQLSQLSDQAQLELHRVIDQAQGELRERASEQTDKLATGLRGWADELRALAEGRTNDAPRAVDWLSQAAGQMTGYADRLDHRGAAGAVEDVSRFARRRPGAFLIGAVIAGFAAGRLARVAQKANADGGPDPTAGRSGSVENPSISGATQPEIAVGIIGRSGSGSL